MAAERVALTRDRDDQGWDDRDAVLHEEVDRLPQRYRAAVVLCDLEGLTQEQAARRLGWPAGTVRSRLARGRDRLRDRLTRRGLAPAAIPLGASLATEQTPAAVPEALVETTVRAGLHLAARQALTGTTALALALTEGVLRIMSWTKFTWIAAIVLAGGVLVGGTSLLGHRVMGLQQAPPAGAKSQPKDQAGVTGGPTAPAPPGPEALRPRDKARLDAARKLRDALFQRWQAGRGNQIDTMEYLTWERRCDDVEGEVTVKNDNDRVRFLERRVTKLKRIEQLARARYDKDELREVDFFAAEFELHEAEDALEKARAKLKARGVAGSDKGSRQLMELLNPGPRPAIPPAPPAVPPLEKGRIPQGAPDESEGVDGDVAAATDREELGRRYPTSGRGHRPATGHFPSQRGVCHRSGVRPRQPDPRLEPLGRVRAAATPPVVRLVLGRLADWPKERQAELLPDRWSPPAAAEATTGEDHKNTDESPS
jgi:hypothetical protein